jgi:nucleoside-diphosphate-sugar epimerase
MKILITGATGFVGRNLMPKLIKEGYDILEITIEPEISRILYGDTVDYYHYKDDNHDNLVNRIFDFKPLTVIHLASYLTSSDSFADLSTLIKTNIIFLTDLLDALKKNPPELFINTGTSAEYFSNDLTLDPAYLYSATKTAARYFLKYYSEAYNFKHLNVVPYSIYGPKDSQKKLIDYLIAAIDSPVPIEITVGKQILDFVHVCDVADAFVKLVQYRSDITNGETFFVGSGKGISVRDLAVMIEKVSGRKLNVNWGGGGYRKRDIMKAIAPLDKNNPGINWKANVDIMDGLIEKLKERKW